MNAHQLKQLINPADFYHHELPDMKPTIRAAWTNAGLCVFHRDTKPNSFFVNLDSGAFRCFSCGASGSDIISFLMERDGLSFPEAINQLAHEWSLF